MFQVHTSSPQRTFTATCLAHFDKASSQPWVEQSPKYTVTRPVLFKFVCSPAVYRPFTANIALGRPVQKDEREVWEFPRRAGYRLYTQEIKGSTPEDDLIVGTYFVEEAFELDPRNPFHEQSEPEDADKDAQPEPKIVKFCMMPPQAELEANAARLDHAAIAAHLERCKLPLAKGEDYIPAYAMLWSAYVDRRLDAPIIQEPAFIAQAFQAARYYNMVQPVDAYGVELLGYAKPMRCSVQDNLLRDLLAAQIDRYQTVTSEK